MAEPDVRILLQIFVIVSLGSGCAHLDSKGQRMQDLLPKSTWFEPKAQAVAVAVVIHGLNTNPAKMQAVVNLLSDSGVSVLRVALSGHRGDDEQFAGVNRKIWLTDAQEAYSEAHHRSESNRVPLFFVGYSLGALVNADFMSSSQDGSVKYDRMVLLAPALATRWYTRLILALGLFGRDYVAQSASPAAYRANFGTPVSAYQALFASKAAVREARFRNLNVPTLVLLDPRDELVSPASLESAMTTFKLSKWLLKFVDNSHSLVQPHYHHLIIDEEAVGHEQWLDMARLIRQHLDLKVSD